MLKVANSVINASQITGVLPVVNGGTGVTTSTGTGNTVLSAAPTLSGNVTLSTGNLVIGTAGKGIDFSITSHPAGMTSELLADYEEGTWTPGVGNQTVVGPFTSNGHYTKIGRQVFIRGQVRGDTSIAGAAGTYITALPFTSTQSGTGTGTIANLTAGSIIFIGPGDVYIYLVGGYAATSNFEFSAMYFA